MPQKNESLWGSATVGNLLKAPKETYQAALAKLGKLREIPDYASNKASELFPGDLDRQNAMRHSLWMGRTAQEMGGGPAAQLATKLAGYGFEGLTAAPSVAMELMNGNRAGAAAIIEDTRQDLNNNAFGIDRARFHKDPKTLENSLRASAINAVEDSPAFYERSRPYLTRAAKQTKQ